MVRHRGVALAKAGAAAMAAATRGRKTRFASRAEVVGRLREVDAEDEMEEALDERRARRSEGLTLDVMTREYEVEEI